MDESPCCLLVCRDEENERTPLMFAALEGDEIIVDVLLACVRCLFVLCVYVCMSCY